MLSWLKNKKSIKNKRISKRKITVDCFTKNSAVKQYASIQSYKNFYPEYWKSLPKSNTIKTNNGINIEYSDSLKTCSAFIDLYKSAFTIPLWADLKLKVDKNKQYFWHWSHEGVGDNEDSIAQPNENQYGEAFNNYTPLKIRSPWLIREKKGVKFYWTEPTWNYVNKFSDTLKILPGVVSYNTSFTTHINILVKTGIGEIMIPYNTPMALIIPLSEENIEFKNHLVDEKEWNKIFNINFYNPTFKSSYKTRSKCPYSGEIKTI